MAKKKKENSELKKQEKEIKKQERKIEKQKEQINEQKSKISYLRRKIRQVKKEKLYKHKMKIKVLKEQLKGLKRQTRNQIIALVTSAFAFVSALFWRDSIQSFLEQNFNIAVGMDIPWFTQTFVAISITIFAAVIIFYVSKLK